ncbi:unnamed protein product [Caretta caretta]
MEPGAAGRRWQRQSQGGVGARTLSPPSTPEPGRTRRGSRALPPPRARPPAGSRGGWRQERPAAGLHRARPEAEPPRGRVCNNQAVVLRSSSEVIYT